MGFEEMRRRLNYRGGAKAQDRMIRDKLKSMLTSIEYSYQGAKFLKYPELNGIFVGLFNPISQTMDYDTKMISTEFKNNLKVGDIFRWEETATYWICYSQDKTELAYFRGRCRRCDYKIQWVDGNRERLETYISVIGPSQPDFITYQPGHGLSVDKATANLVVLASNNEQNKKYFNQYQSFLLNGINYQIHQLDDLSMPGILQLNCVQSKANLIEDDVEENLKNKWNIHPVIEEYSTQYGIEGPTSIKPLFPYEFTTYSSGGRWYILENVSNPKNSKIPVKFETDITDGKIVLVWTEAVSGSFTLCYKGKNTTYKKHIIVESLL